VGELEEGFSAQFVEWAQCFFRAIEFDGSESEGIRWVMEQLALTLLLFPVNYIWQGLGAVQ
jgi:hypothetical protein